MERILVEDVAQISELWKEYAAAAAAGDIERWLALWTDDGIQMPPGAPRLAGKAQIRAGMEPVFAGFDTAMTVHPEEIQVLGDQAYTHGMYEMTMSPRDEGNPMKVEGKFLTILKRGSDRKWRIAVDCFNYNAS